MTDQKQILKNLQTIPNVGPAFARDLLLLGFNEADQLKGKDPVELYQKLSEMTQKRQDPCVLDTFRAVVHYAETGEKKNWWDFTPIRKQTKKAPTN